jgi:hypothetical protein
MCPGHSSKLERLARMRYQPSKLVMRVRFPSPAHILPVTNFDFLFD